MFAKFTGFALFAAVNPKNPTTRQQTAWVKFGRQGLEAVLT
jgi:hypothetical protein